MKLSVSSAYLRRHHDNVVASAYCLSTITFLLYCWLVLALSAVDAAENRKTQQQQQQEELTYGVDISYPMHYRNVSTNYAWLPHNHRDSASSIPVTPPEYQGMPIQPLGNMQAKYDKFLQGCVDRYNNDKAAAAKNKRGSGGQRCLYNERDRLEMTLRQPQSMKNFTQKGFTKIRAPDHVFQLLKDFWEANRDREKLELWHAGNIYTYVRYEYSCLVFI